MLQRCSTVFVAQRQKIELDAAKVVMLAFAYVTAIPNIPSANMIDAVTSLESISVGLKPAFLLFALSILRGELFYMSLNSEIRSSAPNRYYLHPLMGIFSISLPDTLPRDKMHLMHL
ncbi:hypothetical protein ACTXT7_013681 [Hymenolepis weldensis]